MENSLAGTVGLAFAMLGVWIMGLVEHTSQPTWQQLFTMLITWVIIDSVTIGVKLVKLRRSG